MHLANFLQTAASLSPMVCGMVCSDKILHRYQIDGESGSWTLDSILISQYAKIQCLVADRTAKPWLYFLELAAINLLGWPIAIYFRCLM